MSQATPSRSWPRQNYMADPIDSAGGSRDTRRDAAGRARHAAHERRTDMSATRSGELGRGRSGPSLTLSRELAAVRREAAALARENDRLRARLAVRGGRDWCGGPDPLPQAPTASPMSCPSCGLTIAADSASRDHEQVLVLAGCCPICDGRLVAGESPRDPSTYLG